MTKRKKQNVNDNVNVNKTTAKAAGTTTEQTTEVASTKRSVERNDAEIKAESDKRRAARKQQRIRIHANSIENLDETEAQAKKDASEVKETGYSVNARVYYRESRLNWLRRIINALTDFAYAPGQHMMQEKWINRIELKRNFVRNKVLTRCVTIFLGKNKGKDTGLILQPVPMEYLNRMGVEHIEEKKLGWLRTYPFYADLNTYSAVELLRQAGVNPLASKDVRFRLIEMTGKDKPKDKELTYYYKMEPRGEYVPMELAKD